MLGYDDKRNFYRMMVNSPCEVVLVEQPSKPAISAICRDISATGMSLEVETTDIEKGALLEVTIDSNNEQIPSLVAKAKVIRSDQHAENMMLIGVEISEMN